MNEDSNDFSDEGLDDEFEESMEERKKATNSGRGTTLLKSGPFDEAFEVSQDPSVAESFDTRDKFNPMREKERKLVNDRYDEAVEVSQSLDNVNLSGFAMSKPTGPTAAAGNVGSKSDAKGPATNSNPASAKESKDNQSLLRTNTEQTKSQTVLNNRFDEALEFSQSGSDESIDTTNKHRAQRPQPAPTSQPALSTASSAVSNKSNASGPTGYTSNSQPAIASLPANAASSASNIPSNSSSNKKVTEEHSDDEDGDAEESYEHIEGAYNAKDFASLSVPADVRDLFQYIERYKPQEVELDTPLKCFIPEYIPAIGELDAFLKVPRPDGKEDGTGLKFLDEPASNQSDPTVLELNLRAKSKKLQYSDMVVRSIEYAEKNPQKIDKWIHDINELHRNKPPVQVNYKKNMPDLDRLMEAWPPEIEALLNGIQSSGGGGAGNFILPSPELDVSLVEYVKVLCSLLDIPVYDNPVESLHLLFSLFIEFKNNPHFQDRFPDYLNAAADAKDGGRGGGADNKNGAKYNGADVLEINNDDDYKM